MKKLFLSLVILTVVITVSAQETPTWNKKFDGAIKWYKQTETGVLVVSSGDALYGINPESGNELWKLPEFDGIREENYDAIDGSPYVAIVEGGLNKKHVIIDVTSGKVIAKSKELGFTNVTKRIECKKLGAIMFYGSNGNGKPQLVLVDVTTGNKLWEQTKLFEKNSEQIVSEAGITKDGIFIATNRNVYKLNPASGEILWTVDIKSDVPVVPKPKGFGGVFGSKGANVAATATSADFFQYGDSSRMYFWNQDDLTCFNIADGTELWKRVDLSSPINLILYDTRGMLVATSEKTEADKEKANKKGGGLMGKLKRSGASNKNRAGLYCFDYATGAEKWNDEVDLQGDIIAYKMNGNKLILATQRDQGTNYITIADLDAGKSVTKKALKVDGEVTDLHIVPQGLYYRTNKEINILDIESGDRTWKKGFKVKNCTGANANDDLGYVYGNGSIYKVDFEKGDLSEWVSNINFDGGEEPTNMEVRDNGVLLSSSQNVRLYAIDGKQAWHTYEKAPGRTNAGKFLSGFAGVVAMSVSLASAANAAQLSYAKGYYGSTSSSLDNQIKASNQMASAWGNASISSFKSINRRFKASRSANDFMAVLTNFGSNNSKDNVGVVYINKKDGSLGKRILMGDKDPDYTLDEIDRMLFYWNSKNELTAYRF